MDELTIGDKIYISSKRAAEITGYAKDYIGQLCREGRVEATLVGRSWYVLESSLRTHRFGASTVDEASEKTQEKVESTAFSTWNAPSYEAEAISDVPQLERRSVNILENAVSSPAETVAKPESIEDMQAAWKEWFASRQEPILKDKEPIATGILPVNPMPSEEVEIEREEAVEIKEEKEVYDPVPSTPEVEEPVQIHRAYEVPAAPVATPSAQNRVDQTTRVRRKKKRTYLALRALLIAVALLAIAIGAVGAGYADSLAKKPGIEYTFIRFLGGTSLLNK